jgi:hypothetical protein
MKKQKELINYTINVEKYHRAIRDSSFLFDELLTIIKHAEKNDSEYDCQIAEVLGKIAGIKIYLYGLVEEQQHDFYCGKRKK